MLAQRTFPRASNELALVFPDACLDTRPIVLDPVPANPGTVGAFAVTSPTASAGGLAREVKCDPLGSRDQIAAELPGVGETATGR